MLVDNSVYRNSYVANGSTTKFAISFPFLDNAHIIVYKNVNGTESVVNSSEYTITGAGQQNGGTLTFGSAPSNGTIIVIARNVPITQLHKYTELDNFPAESHEDALAKLTMIDQQQQDSINRAIKLAETDTRTPDELLNDIFTAKDVAVACATESCQCADNADTSRNEALQFRNEAEAILNSTISEGEKAVANVQAQEASSIQAIKDQEATSVAVVEAEGDTQVVRLVDMANNILISGTAYNKEVTADITVATPAETYITLPVDSKGNQLMYRVGAAMIRMSYNGAQMYVGDQFDEVGIAGSISSQIKVNFDLEAGSRLNFFIIAQNVTVIVDESSGLSIDEQNRLSAAGLKEHVDDTVALFETWARHVGDEWHSFTGQIPSGGVPYLGQIVTRATYADLWEYVQNNGLVKTEDEWQAMSVAQNGNVPFYSSGDGSTTFRMPKLVGYIKGAGSLDEAGGYTAEGLPNITGQIDQNRSVHSLNIVSGAFVSSSLSGTSMPAYEAGSGDLTLSFDASRSNSIYGNSEHVTPETSIILFGVYAFGEIVNTGALDAETLANGLATVEARIVNWNPVGTVIAYSANSAPEGYILCNGAAVSRTTYGELFEKIGTLYGEGDGSTTFNLPNLTDKFIQGSGTAGTVKSAGLPGITGSFFGGSWGLGITSVSGAFSGKTSSNTGTDGSAYNRGEYGGADFNAKSSSAIYGASTTVQPPALTMRYYIKY